jgi:hypothetical protein
MPQDGQSPASRKIETVSTMHLRNYALYDQKAAIQSVGDFAAYSFEFIRAQYVWKKQAFKCSVFQLMIQQDFESNAAGEEQS